MKQQTITIGNRTILVLDLPKGVRTFEYIFISGFFIYTYNDVVHSHIIGTDLEPLGFISEFTEEQAMMIYEDRSRVEFDEQQISDYLEQLVFDIQSNGILTVNQYLKPEFRPNFVGHNPENDYSFQMLFKQWQTAQSQLWENIVMLEKV